MCASADLLDGRFYRQKRARYVDGHRPAPEFQTHVLNSRGPFENACRHHESMRRTEFLDGLGQGTFHVLSIDTSASIAKACPPLKSICWMTFLAASALDR